MRLIDADMFRQEADNEDKNGVLTFRDVALWIEEQPTVEAIPLSFIEEMRSYYAKNQMLGCESVLTGLVMDWAEKNGKTY